MSRLRHKKAIILAVIGVVMLGLVTGVVLIKKPKNENSKLVNVDNKLEFQYLTTDNWFQKLGKVQVYRQYEGKSENFKLLVEDRLEYRSSSYIKKGTNYDDPYFYMKSIVVTEYIGEKDIKDIKIMQIQEKSLRGEGTRWNEEPINCFNDNNLYITQHKSDPASVNINEHSMTFTFDDGTTETVEAKLIDSQGDLADVDVVFDKEAVKPIIFTIKDAKKSKDLKLLLNTKVSAVSLSIENGKLAWCNLVLVEDDDVTQVVLDQMTNRFLDREVKDLSKLPYDWVNLDSKISLVKVMNREIVIEKWMDASFGGKYNHYSVNLRPAELEIEDNSMDRAYQFKGKKIIECEPEFINDAEGKFIVYTGEEQYVVYY